MGTVGDDGFGAYEFVEGALAAELCEGATQVGFEGVPLVAKLGGA